MSNPSFLFTILMFLAVIGPLIFIHELGHYFVGRWFGVKADTFSIGFGRELFGWTDKQGTRWKVAWLPLGGYVRFIGDMSPASNPAELEAIPPELRDRAFQVRPVWQRFLVVLAGPAANFLLAILIFAAFFTMLGTPSTNVVGAIKPDSAAAKAGIEPGDRITSVAGQSTPGFADVFNVVAVRPNQTVDIAVERRGVVQRLRVTLGSDEMADASGQKFERGLLGIYPTTRVLEPVPVLKAVPMAIDYTARLTRAMADGILQLIRGHVSAKQIGGPIKIAQIAGEGASQGLLPFAQLLALFSINLGFINLLPVPMLDGGHLFFYAVEAVRRRPLSARALDWAFRGGLAVLLALLVFTTVNDLGSLGLWDRLQRLIG